MFPVLFHTNSTTISIAFSSIFRIYYYLSAMHVCIEQCMRHRVVELNLFFFSTPLFLQVFFFHSELDFNYGCATCDIWSYFYFCYAWMEYACVMLFSFGFLVVFPYSTYSFNWNRHNRDVFLWIIYWMRLKKWRRRWFFPFLGPLSKLFFPFFLPLLLIHWCGFLKAFLWLCLERRKSQRTT